MSAALSPVTLIMMVGGSEATDVERIVTRACHAAALDTLDRARASGAMARFVVATNSAALGDEVLEALPEAAISLDSGEFHFGRRLLGLVEFVDAEAIFYCGGGAAVLMDSEALGQIARSIACEEDLLVTNNCYSSDFCAFSPADALCRIEPPETDNDLAWRLATRAGMRALVLPAGAASLLDIDTPTDLLTLLAHPGAGPRLRRYLEGLSFDRTAVDGVLRVMRRPGARIAIAGRVGSAVCRYLQARTGCEVIPYSEERGLRASGRQARHEARSYLAFLAHTIGWRGVMESVAQVADAFLFDTRVALAHARDWPSAADRFWSDLLRPEMVGDAEARELTEAAAEAGIPVMLGGHSLVSGGLYALVDAAVGPANGEGCATTPR